MDDSHSRGHSDSKHSSDQRSGTQHSSSKRSDSNRSDSKHSDCPSDKKGSRNKTITLTIAEGQQYLSRCISLTDEQGLKQGSKAGETAGGSCLSAAGKITVDMIRDRTILGDTFAVVPSLPERFVDLLIVDPPYNLNKEFSGSRFRQTDDEAYAAYTEDWIKAVRPVLKPEASIYVCCDWRSSAVIGLTLKKYFTIQNRITWQREKGRGALHNWKNGMEDIWFATLSDTFTFNVEAVKQRRRVVAPYRSGGEPKDWEETADGRFRNTFPSNFWDDISIPYWSMPENTGHPTQKPEKLLAKLILASSNPGDVVFDPFLGSGSTSVTAKKLGRHYVGIEASEQYCIWAERRLEMAEENQTIQGYTDGVFWERNTQAVQQSWKNEKTNKKANEKAREK